MRRKVVLFVAAVLIAFTASAQRRAELFNDDNYGDDAVYLYRSPSGSASVYFGGDFVLGWQSVKGDAATDAMNIRTRNSVELGVPNFLGVSFDTEYLGFSLGAGVMKKMFKNKGGLMYSADDNGKLQIGTIPSDSKRYKTRLDVNSITVLPQVGFKIGGVKLSFGPMVNFNYSSKTISKYTLNGSREKVKGGSPDVAPVTVDWMLMARGWSKGSGIYVKYAPKAVLDTDINPDFSVWSFGIIL